MIEASSGNSLPLDPSILASYRRRMRGELYAPDAATVEEAGCVHRQRDEEQPALVARCLSAHDVALAIALARELQLELAVYSGGYSQAGRHGSRGCLLVDLSQLRQITLDPLQRIARVGPGATNDELARVAAAHGLATTGASASVGMGSSTDNILAFEVVNAEGSIITASAHERPDLFWALYGSIDIFGVVTAITYRLHLSQPEQQTNIGDNSWTSQ
jgi:FAD/FMN-containing dehydrogenase